MLGTGGAVPMVMMKRTKSVRACHGVSITSGSSISFLCGQLRRLGRCKDIVHVGLSPKDSCVSICCRSSLVLAQLSICPCIRLKIILVFMLMTVFTLLDSGGTRRGGI